MALLRCRRSPLALDRAAALSSYLRRSFSAIASSPPSPLPLLRPTSSTALAAASPRLPFRILIGARLPQYLIQSLSFRSSAPLSNRRFDAGGRDDERTIGPDEILFEGCDYNHWLITMDFPKDPAPTREEMIETYVETLAKVVGSVEEAKKRMYACSTTTYHGFQAVMTEEMSEKFKGLPGVVFVLPDSYIDPVNKEYGGDKYDNGVITPRPPPIQYRPTRPRNQNRYDRPNYNRPPPQGNLPPNQLGPMQGDGRHYAPQQNYSQPGQDGRGYGDSVGRGFAPSGDRRDFGQGEQRNYAQFGERNVYPGERRDPMPSHQRDFSQGDRGNFVPQNQRNFSQGLAGDNQFADPSANGNNWQGSGPSHNDGYNQQKQSVSNYSGDHRSSANTGYTGDNRQGGPGYGHDYMQGPGSPYRQS